MGKSCYVSHMPRATKVCTKCLRPKRLNQFHSDKSRKDGLHYICKVCKNKQYSAATVDPVKYRQKRDGMLRRQFGITLAEYEALVVAQGGRCAICGTDDLGPTFTYWCVDHDHKTGKVRGLLCHTCNVGIGMLKDDIEVVKSALAYLRKKRR